MYIGNTLSQGVKDEPVNMDTIRFRQITPSSHIKFSYILSQV